MTSAGTGSRSGRTDARLVQFGKDGEARVITIMLEQLPGEYNVGGSEIRQADDRINVVSAQGWFRIDEACRKPHETPHANGPRVARQSRPR